jgi:hypothetical protein
VSVGYYIDEFEPPTPSIWKRINRLLWVLLILTTVALIIGAFLPELDKQTVEREESARLTRLIDEQKALLDRNRRKVGWLTNDPEYLGIVARDRLNLMQQGDTILVIEPSKDPVLQAQPPAPPISSTRKGKSLN